MTHTPVVFVSYRRPGIASGYNRTDYHDLGLFHRVIESLSYSRCDGFDELSFGSDGAVVVVPAQHHHMPPEVERLNRDLADLRWVVMVLAGDEHSLFPWRDVEHPNMRWWVMTPRPHLHADLDAFWLGEGYRYDTPDTLAVVSPEGFANAVDVFFAGQVTHERRVQMWRALNRPVTAPWTAHLLRTSGFLQGMPHDEYLERMAFAKIVPCPSGPGTPDSFRLYEALEAGCVPLADATTPDGWTGYWEFVYGEVPFPIIEDWRMVGEVIERELAAWPGNAAECALWWQDQKRRMAQRLDDDVRRVMSNA